MNEIEVEQAIATFPSVEEVLRETGLTKDDADAIRDAIGDHEKMDQLVRGMMARGVPLASIMRLMTAVFVEVTKELT